MVGAVAMRSAWIWARSQSNQPLTLRYFPAKESSPVRETVGLQRTDGVVHFELTHLEPGESYEYRLLQNGQEIRPEHQQRFTTKPLWKYRQNDPPDFSFALGSCHYVNEEPYDRKGRPFGAGYEIFSSISNEKPDFFLWMGDNVYLREADWDSRHGIYARYAHTRDLRESRAFFAALPQFAIWDDHDFGPNNASRSFTLSRLTEAAFKEYWPDFNYPGLGIYRSFAWGDAEFFLLDNRTFRTPGSVRGATILGEGQKAWLREALTESSARFKFIVLGGQLLNSEAVFENYATLPGERTEILQMLQEQRIRGVIVLSGDRHHSEISRLERDDYPLYEFTVSPLTAGTFAGSRENNRYRLPGSLFQDRAFGVIELKGPADRRIIEFRLKDSSGKTQNSLTIKAKDIGG